jgi:threonine aldolase
MSLLHRGYEAMVNLYSDTQTRPTAAMRDAMVRAEVGDEQRGADPTTAGLEERVAALLGHEAAVFLPSGTMCNQIAIRLHVRPGGDEILLGRDTHPLRFEAGGPAAVSGAVMTVVEGEGSMFSPAALDAAVRAHPLTDRYAPRPRLVCVEQTTAMGGGRVWSLQAVRAVLDVAAEHGLRTHLDGARLLNAVVASGVAADAWAGGFDTAWLDFSKGLGAPVGACLAGPREVIDEAWRYKQMLGGAMRQSGVVAAAALHALDHHVGRLAEDHRRARRLAEGLAALDGVDVDLAAVESNIVIFGVDDAPALCAAISHTGVTMGVLDARRVRAVTHLDVDDAGVELASRRWLTRSRPDHWALRARSPRAGA